MFPSLGNRDAGLGLGVDDPAFFFLKVNYTAVE